METYASLIKKRRSIRNYRENDVPPSVIYEIIRDCTCAPSAGDRQPWTFIVITDRTMMKRLSDESKMNLRARLERDDSPSLLRRYEPLLKNDSFNVFYNAPCLVYIGGDPAVRSLTADCACAAVYFMFAATARGLGTCWIDLGKDIRSEELRREIGMPADFSIVAPLILGYPATIPPPPQRDKPEIIHVRRPSGNA